ncbi:MAG: hypothetical protein P8169_05675, partial [Chloroflexota bacterium]
ARRDERIEDLEKQTATLNQKLNRLPEIDQRITIIREELFEQLEQYDKRRVLAEQESDRLRRIEHESLAREIADTRKELPAIGRLQRDMELRIAEESRLAKLIAVIQSGIDPLRNQISEWERALAFVEEKEKQNTRDIADIQTQLLEISKRWEAAQRADRQVDERIHELEEQLLVIEDDKDTIWRIQAAQADAIKTLPRIWLEEIEKAKAQNPNRRRQPTVMPVREE